MKTRLYSIIETKNAMTSSRPFWKALIKFCEHRKNKISFLKLSIQFLQVMQLGATFNDILCYSFGTF